MIDYMIAQVGGIDTPTLNNGVTMVTVLMCLIQGVFTYLTNRDRLAFDIERNNLSHAVKELESRADECLKDRIQLQKELDRERSERDTQYREIARQMRHDPSGSGILSKGI
jgi:hypothetical protein